MGKVRSTDSINSPQVGQARLGLKISGRVQGVFFRAQACQQAQNLGLSGLVRNAADGTVEIVAEGERDALEKLHRWCQKGPPFAQVEKAEAKWEPYRGEFKKFGVTC